jgi:hypothetical protein
MVNPQTDVLSHPEVYLLWINFSFAALAGAAIYFLGSRLLIHTGSRIVALIAQISFLASVSVVAASLTLVSLELPVLGLGALLSGLLVPLIFIPSLAHYSMFRAVACGLAIGTAIASKVTAAPLVLTIFLFKFWPERFGAVFVTGITFGVLTLPVTEHWGQLYGWVWALAAHSGYYGTGGAGVLAASTIGTRFINSFSEAPDLYLSLMASLLLATVGAASVKRSKIEPQFFAISAAIIAIEIAMVIKHPALGYYLPAVAIAALVNGVAALFMLIPNPIDQNPWAHWRSPMDMMRQG